MLSFSNPNFPGAVITIDQAIDQIQFTIKTPEGANEVRSIRPEDPPTDQAGLITSEPQNR